MQQPPHSPSAAAARPAPPSSNEGGTAQDPLPFTSLPSWPQTHLLHQAAQAQQAAAGDGHVHHAYLHHALQLAQRAAMHGKPPPPPPASGQSSLNNLKLQEYLNLQSSMSSPSASGDRPPLPKQPIGPQAHRQQQQQQQSQPQPQPQQRSMGFLFGQSSSAPILHTSPAVQATRPPMTSGSAQQFVVPESVQARMLTMHKAAAENQHLRLGPQQAEVEAANGTNGLVAGHALSRLAGYQHSSSPELGPNRSMLPVPPAKQPSPLQRLNQPQTSPQQAGPAAQAQQQQHFPPLPASVPSAAAKTFGFTRQQLMVLRAQILAFRRLKRGDRSFTVEMVRAITPAPLTPSPQAPSAPAAAAAAQASKAPDTGDDKAKQEGGRLQESGVARKVGETVQEAALSRMGDEERKGELIEVLSLEQRKGQGSWRYRGPLFDAPPEGAANTPPNVWGSPLAFGYDAAELLMQEGERIICKKKARKLKVIEMLLSDDVPAELKLKLRIEQRKLVLLEMQTKIRNEIEEHQQEIMAMGERAYRKFVRLCERQRMELARQVMVVQKATKEKYLKSIVQWRKKLFETHWSVREARANRNKGVVKFHERMLREFSKRKDEDRSKRMEALKNNDVDAYRAMLIKQQKEIPGDAKQRFEVLSSFLTQTEDYLHKLGSKISAVKSQQEKEEAALAAAAAARAQGLPEEEVERASAQARNLAGPSRSWKLENASGGSSVNKYYNLAHAVNEQVVRQPSMLRAGILRDYQLVGLQWMLSLYNNRLNGILADEMGLGKTVQVMALVAYLMEFKGNYGPHLIIVPNAVIVNWKSELLRWLPSVSCIFYVGAREERARIYSQEVAALKFNVLVTTYEFIMRDRSKLAKVDWKYIIIDEAQRMKDRESRLARDLDRFRCQRRLLLTGTPLQNDLHELWSLLNLLLPEVFDNSKAFHDWFSKPFQKDNQTIEDDWLETEKKVIVIHRLHQILEPFMLRRRVEDVEGSLPPKVSIVLKCKMSAHQAAIYDWVKATGTIRLDPAEEQLRIAGGSKRQVRAYAPLQNKCMELRKVCNHPYLNYPPPARAFNENVVRMCGKLWILDRILIKLQRSGHRVLLFSTMTKLLDILEDYLQWRGLIYRRIDGTTPLESREAAIVDFNAPGSQCFIFLLSIRAAGRGLNLQTADTVVIYDPDPNPKNEEQAVARAHRIGQKSEVKVIYMEAVVDTIPSYQKEDEIRNGGSLDVDDEMLAGKDRYMGSVESLVRNNIQQHKIDMADEVINAGRFDQRTTHEERRMTLEALLHDEERYQETVHDVPALKEVNRMISRSEEEVELFDQMDEECEWPGDMIGYDEVPEWLHVGTDEVNGAIRATSKQSLIRGGSGGSGLIGTKAEEDKLLAKSQHRRARNGSTSKGGRPAAAALKRGGKPAYEKLAAAVEEAEELEEDDADTSSQGEEDEDEGEVRLASEEEEEADAKSRKVEVQAQDDSDEEQAEEEEDEDEDEDEEEEDEEEENGSSEEAEDQSPGTQTEAEDLEEGEIAVSGESRDSPPSGNWAANEQEEEEQVATTTGSTPRKKRKRSTRPRRNFMGNVPVQEAYPAGYMPSSWRGAGGASAEAWGVAGRGAAGLAAPRGIGWISPATTAPGRQQSGRTPEAPTAEDSRNVRSGPKMQENVQKKCKQVLSKLQGAMNRDGRQVSALLMELPKQHELPDYYKVIDKPIDAKTIEEHLDRFDYATVLDFAGDVQLMLDNASRYNTTNPEVQADARRLHSLFFQRMGLMFPDVDFNSIKVSIGMASRASGSRSSRKQRQVFSEVGRLVESAPVKEESKATSREQERKRTAAAEKTSKGARSTSSRIVGATGQDAGGFLHPADLVIYKRKRSSRRSKTRPKAAAAAAAASKRKRDANTSSSLSGRRKESELKGLVDSGGPLSWARARAVAAALAAGGDTPRKKPRTDSARRRPATSAAGRSS